MHDPTKSLRRLNLAIKFGLKLDLTAIEKRLDQSVALSGIGSGDEAIARYSLVFTQKGPKEAALYIAKHREQLYSHLQKLPVMGTEIELLAQAGSINAANERLAEAKKEGLSERHQEVLRKSFPSALVQIPSVSVELCMNKQATSARSSIWLPHLRLGT